MPVRDFQRSIDGLTVPVLQGTGRIGGNAFAREVYYLHYTVGRSIVRILRKWPKRPTLFHHRATEFTERRAVSISVLFVRSVVKTSCGSGCGFVISCENMQNYN